MASYLDKEGLSTFLDCLREEELAPIQNDVSSLQQTKADNETVVNGLNAVSEKIDNVQGENAEATLSAIYATLNEMKGDVIDIVKLQLENIDNLLSEI